MHIHWKITLGVLGVFLFLLILAGFSENDINEKVINTPTPTLSPTITPIIEVPSPTIAGFTSLPIVERVIDGDTLVLKNGEVVRLIGIDAPETGKECLSAEAKSKLETLTLGKKVRLEKDISEDDRFNRLLRYIWIDKTFVNEVLVREGFASSLRYPPDVKYLRKLDEAEQSARQNKRGIWNEACKEHAPEPATTPTKTTTTASEKNPIDCSSNTYNCSDFTTCSEAMAVLAACPNDIHQLDQDGDGTPCEALCS